MPDNSGPEKITTVPKAATVTTPSKKKNYYLTSTHINTSET